MDVIAWIVLALLAGVVARQATGRRAGQHPPVTAVIVKIPPTSRRR